MPAIEWSLHPRLEQDTAPVGVLALCCVRAIDDADFPWLVLVPRRAGAVEIADLGGADAALLMTEIVHASRALKAVTGCDKINVGAIGNVVPQLHIHIVARRRADPLWPKAIWGLRTPQPGKPAKFSAFVTAAQAALVGG